MIDKYKRIFRGLGQPMDQLTYNNESGNRITHTQLLKENVSICCIIEPLMTLANS